MSAVSDRNQMDQVHPHVLAGVQQVTSMIGAAHQRQALFRLNIPDP